VAKKEKDRTGEVFTLDGKDYVCIDAGCVKIEYLPKTGERRTIFKAECSGEPDPDFPRKVRMIMKHQATMKGRITRDLVEKRIDEDADAKEINK
jgi:hypothetical protein